MFGEHTQHVEALWSALKRYLRGQFGGSIPSDPEGLAANVWEYMWRTKMEASGDCLVRHWYQSAAAWNSDMAAAAAQYLRLRADAN